jgi:DNA-binding beta-propeller fold protein YncE
VPALRPTLGACLAALTLCSSASAARTVYFSDPWDDEIAQFGVSGGGTLGALDPAAVDAEDPGRMAMTPAGTDLYATGEDGVLQFDVAEDGRLTPKDPALAPARGWLHSIAIRPDGKTAYVTDAKHGKVRQFDIGPEGELTAKDPAYQPTGSGTRGVAVSPDGKNVYVLVTGGIVVFDVGADGSLTRRGDRVDVPSCDLKDVALTPDGANLYATSGDGRVFQFSVGSDGTPVAGSPPALEADGRPRGIAISPDGTAVYVTSSGRVLAYTVGAGGDLSPAGGSEARGWKPLGYLSVSPDGTSLFVAGGDGFLFDLGAGGTVTPKDPPEVDLRAAVGVVVSPNQAPVASFTAAPGPAGSATQFDASAAVDPDGSIVRYDWDFGDGSVLLDGGPKPTHVYTKPGKYTVTLVVTDDEGASTTTIFTGGTVLGNGAPGAQTSREIEVAAPTPEQVGAQPLPPVPQLPLPDLGQTLVAEPVSGTIRVKVAGTKLFVPLETVRELPLGSTLDARRGRVEIATERKRRGRVQQGVFYDGLFVVRQRARSNFVTDVVLRGSLDSCPRGSASAARRSRRLWGNSTGRFRTRGRYSSGAVRGTRWLTVDRCDGTLTVVREGTVAVRDFELKKTLLLDAGERYLARPR